MLHGKLQGRNRFSRQAHAQTGDAGVEAGAVAHYPATEGLSSTQILALVREHARPDRRRPEPLPARAARAASACPAGADALSAVHFPAVEADADVGRRRLAFDELLLAQLALLRRRADARARARARRSTATAS